METSNSKAWNQRPAYLEDDLTRHEVTDGHSIATSDLVILYPHTVCKCWHLGVGTPGAETVFARLRQCYVSLITD